jgi:integrase
VNPLAVLKQQDAAADVRHARRDLSADELGRLVGMTRASGRPFMRLAGPDRAMIYLTAVATGFRTSELASMTPESFALTGPRPTATVRAACTKNRKLAVQPLPLDVAAALADYLADKPAGQPVWPGTWAKDKSAKMIRRDLADARAAWVAEAEGDRQRAERDAGDFLAYRDAEGRYADFHCLRHTFITMVGKLGLSPREHQDLARHATYNQTSRYSHSRMYDLAEAVQRLPIPLTGPATGDAETLRATGTDGHAEAPKKSGLNLGPQPALLGSFLTLREPGVENAGVSETAAKQAKTADFVGECEGAKKGRPRVDRPRPSTFCGCA